MIDQIARSEIWREYVECRPRPGSEYEGWVEATAAKWQTTRGQVKKVVAQESFHQHDAIMAATQATVAQKAANLLGAGVVDAIGKLRECMRAKNRKPLRDGNGRPVKDENGKVVWIETPEWNVQLKAAEVLLNVHGGLAPEKIQVDHRHMVANVTDAELAHQYEKLNESIRELIASTRDGSVPLRAIAAPDGSGPTVSGRDEGAAGPP